MNRLGLLSDRSEVLKAQSKHPRRELTENLVGSHHLDKSNPSTSVKIQTFLHADDRPADNIFQSEKQRQSVFTSPRKASAVACTAESDRGKMLPSATSSQPAVMEQRARAPRFNVITGRDF